MNNQKTQLYAHLKAGRTITALEALQLYGCFCLSQRLGELRRAGVPIESEYITTANDKRIKQYWLAGSK